MDGHIVDGVAYNSTCRDNLADLEVEVEHVLVKRSVLDA